MISKHAKVTAEKLLSFCLFRISVRFIESSPIPTISYIMKRSFMQERYLLEQNANVLLTGNMDAILDAFIQQIVKHKQEHFNLLKQNAIPVRAETNKSETWRRTLYVDKIEIKQITHSILKITVSDVKVNGNKIGDDYQLIDKYGYTFFRRVHGKQNSLKSLESMLIYLWEKKRRKHLIWD